MKSFQTLSAILITSVMFGCGSDDGQYTSGGIAISPDSSSDSSNVSDSSDSSDSSDVSDSSALSDVTIIVEAPAEANNFNYVGSSEAWLAIQGTGGKSSTTITFQLLDIYGQAIVSEPVTFELTGPEGTTLVLESSETDSNGNVSTAVNAGSAAGPVIVTVISENDPTILSSSNGLFVSTGFPDQDSFSIFADKLSVPGINRKDAKVAVTVALADADGNAPIPDGTVVTFRAEAGRIESAANGLIGSCTTVNSQCSMTWTSIGEMPDDGEVTILAYALGVESFKDVNPSDGIYNDGEVFTDNAEVFLDENYNEAYDFGEWYLDVDDALGDNDQAYTIGDGKYTGMQCEENVDYCDQRFIYIYKQMSITVSTDEHVCEFRDDAGAILTSVDLTVDPSVTVSVSVSDLNGNTPATGTVINATATNGTVNGDATWTVPNGDNTAYTFDVELVADSNKIDSGSLVIKSQAAAPAELVSKCTLTVIDTPSTI